MKFRRIIEKFSVLLLSTMLCFILEAQDLEEVLPRKVEVSIIDYSEDLEPSIMLTEEQDSKEVAIIDSQYLEVVKQAETDNVNLESKEAQLGMILRSAYYQKITTPRWAKILSSKSWRASFLKWRYYAQIEDYIRSSNNELVKMKSKSSLAISSSRVKEKQYKSELVIDSVESISTAALTLLEETKPSKKRLLPDNPQETTEEETFDTDSVVMVAEDFIFSKADLSFPDSILSERALYPKELIVTEKIEEAPMLVEVEAIEKKKKVEDHIKQEKEIVSSKVEQPKAKEAIAEIKEDNIQATVQKDIVVSESEVEKVIPPESSVSVPPINLTDRRDITEQFASMYSKLPWPVNGGNITDKYGYRRNAAARGLKTENYGIDVSAPSASNVKAVFSGTVLMAIKQAPYDYIVTLKHGDFTSAYYFLNKVNVKVGDNVVVGQNIGKLREEQGMAPFHFEIWQGQERINPEPWLK